MSSLRADTVTAGSMVGKVKTVEVEIFKCRK